VVIWSGRPLSTLTRCEQVWIDGRRYFDLESDLEMRRRDAQLRARLIQKILDDGNSPRRPSKQVAEEDRWQRHDVFCTAHGGIEHDHTGHMKRQ
ncbi:MAG: hypothetical protein MI861_02255, partial [Pirellulales bacterium]|nr:hypothetical protein [Pirellulales bacterium]